MKKRWFILLILLVLIVIPSVFASEVFYLHPDYLGSPIGLTDGNGIAVEEYAYDPYGKQIVTLDAEVENPIGFTGQRFDDSVGLNHFYFRTYDPELGRFLQRDPSGYADGVNLYEYVAGNPLGATDPMGLQAGPFDDIVNLARRLSEITKVPSDELVLRLSKNPDIAAKLTGLSPEDMIKLFAKPSSGPLVVGTSRATEVTAQPSVIGGAIAPSQLRLPPQLTIGQRYTSEQLRNLYKDYYPEMAFEIAKYKGKLEFSGKGASVTTDYRDYLKFAEEWLDLTINDWIETRKVANRPSDFFRLWRKRATNDLYRRHVTGVNDRRLANNIYGYAARLRKSNPSLTLKQAIEAIKIRRQGGDDIRRKVVMHLLETQSPDQTAREFAYLGQRGHLLHASTVRKWARQYGVDLIPGTHTWVPTRRWP